MLGLLGLGNLVQAQEVKINTNMVVESDGTIRTDGNATVWDDLMVFADATSKGGSNPPTMSTEFKDNGSASQGVYVWMFASGTEQEVYFTVQIPHARKADSDLYPHVHWTTVTGTPSGSDVVWGLEYTVVSIGGSFSNTTIITAGSVIGSISISGTGQHLINSFSAIEGTGLGISSVIVCRLFRKVGDAADTFANAVGLLGVDFHYEKDTDGSRSEFTK